MISGKWWGDLSRQPILAVHGWQDNAGSFDPLLEALPLSTPVLAIDSPGHGLSSHYPTSMLYHSTNYVLMLRRVQRYFKWNQKMTIIAHSEGGAMAFLFAATFPESVHTLINLDVIKPIPRNPNIFKNYGEKIDTCVKKGRRSADDNVKYSMEDIEKLLTNGFRKSLTPAAVKVLIKRGTKFDEDSGKYLLTRDPRLKLPTLHQFNEDHILEFARNLSCHYLVIKFSQENYVDSSLLNAPSFVKTLNEVTKSFETVIVEGSHFTHLINPELVVPRILECFKSKVL